MFERFTERAREVVALAQKDARDRGHTLIGSEHILMGLIVEHEGLGARVLEKLDITAEKLDPLMPPSNESKPSVGQIPFTPRCTKLLELALREALSLGHNYIGTEHILLGVVRMDECLAARVLRDNFDADASKVRDEVIGFLSGPGRKVAHEKSRLFRAAELAELLQGNGTFGVIHNGTEVTLTLTDYKAGARYRLHNIQSLAATGKQFGAEFVFDTETGPTYIFE